MTTLTPHVLNLVDIPGVVYRQNLQEGDDITTADTVNPSTLPATAGSPGTWVEDADGYHVGASAPGALGADAADLAAIEFTAVGLTELRLVTKCKYNTGWLTIWEETSPGTWELIAELSSRYATGHVKATSFRGDVKASWTLPVPLTKYDVAANTDYRTNPGPDDFLNVEFYLYWDASNTDRTLRVVSLGNDLEATCGNGYWNGVPIHSIDFITGAVAVTERLPYHVPAILSGRAWNLRADRKCLTNDRYNQDSAAAGLYATNPKLECLGGLARRVRFTPAGNVVVLTAEDWAEPGDAASVTRYWLREYDAAGIFRKEVLLSGEDGQGGAEIGAVFSALGDAGVTTTGWGACSEIVGPYVDASGRYVLTALWAADTPGSDYLIRLAADFSPDAVVALPKVLNSPVYDRQWKGLWMSAAGTEIWVMRTDGEARKYNGSLALQLVKQITEAQITGTLAGNPNWVFVEGEWHKNSAGEWVHCVAVAHKVYVLDSNFNYLRHFGDAGTNVVGGIIGSGGTAIDAQNRVYNQDQNTVQCWKSDGFVTIGQQAGDDQIAFVVGNEDGSSNLWLEGAADVEADPLTGYLYGGDAELVKLAKVAKQVRTDLDTAAPTPLAIVELSKFYGRTGAPVANWLRHKTQPWTSKNQLVSPQSLGWTGTDLLVLEGRRRVTRYDVSDKSAPFLRGTAQEVLYPAGGATTLTLGAAFEPTTLVVDVDGEEKTLRVGSTQTAEAYDYTTNPETFAWSDAGSFSAFETKNGPSGEQAINQQLIGFAPFMGGEIVTARYVPAANAANEIILTDATLTDRFARDYQQALASHRFTADAGNLYVLLPYRNSFGADPDRQIVAGYLGTVQTYSLATGLRTASFDITAQVGFKSDIKLVGGNLWVLNHDTNQVHVYNASGTHQATHDLSITGARYFSERNHGGNVLVVGHTGLEALNTSGVSQWTASSGFIEDAKFVEVAPTSNDIYVGAWNQVLLYDGSTRAFLGRIEENGNGGELETPHLMDLVIDEAGTLFLLKGYQRVSNGGYQHFNWVSHVRIFDVA